MKLSIKLLCAFVLTLTLSGFTKAQTITLQPDTAGIDVIMSSTSNTTNYGTFTTLEAKRWTSGGVPFTLRGLIKFAGLSTIPIGSIVSSAVLTLGGVDHSPLTQSNACYLQRITQNWVEGTVTWNTQPTTTTTGQISTAQSTSATQDFALTVTSMVQKMIDSSSTNYGWMLRLQSEANYYTKVTFASSDYTTTPSKRPKLVVTYAPGYFRSKQTGNWNSASTWETSSDNVNWYNATTTPKYTANTITIQSAHTVTITATDTLDQTVVNGTLVYNGGTLRVNNGTGVDLIVNGTIQDDCSNGISWATSATWSIGSSGTIIKTSASNCDLWRDAYDGGISTIPATATWNFRKTGATAPSISTASMTYPNMTFENNYASATTWTIGYAGSAAHPTVKGNFDVGGSGTYHVVFENTNTNGTMLKIQGGLTVKTTSAFRIYNNVGTEVQGNITANGTVEFSTYTGPLLLSGTSNQTIGGVSQTWKTLTINKNIAAKTVTLSIPLTITGTLTFTKGKIISTSTNFVAFNNGAAVSGTSDSSFVSGVVKKTGNTAFVFPTGKSNNYQPISISAPANSADVFVAEYFNTGQTLGSLTEANITNLSTCEYWSLNETTGTDSVFVTLGVDAGTCNILTERQLMFVTRHNGTLWKNLYNFTNNSNGIQSLLISAGGTYTIANSTSGLGHHSLFVCSDGYVWGCGFNSNGQIGDNTTTQRNTPVQVHGPSGFLSNIKATASSTFFSLALSNSGTVWAWGLNNYGQLGNGTTTQSNTAIAVSGLTNVIAIAAGGGAEGFALALKSDGTVWAWGANSYGTLGNGTTTSSNVPIQVSGLTNVVSIAATVYNSYAITSNGSLWAWGENLAGQLGNGNFTPSLVPVVSSITGVREVCGGHFNCLVLKTNGTVWVTGDNSWGQFGNGSVNTSTFTNTFTQATTVPSGITAISYGDNAHAHALRNNGTLWSWGNNDFGQLGDGTTTNSSSAIQITVPSCPIRISSSNFHSFVWFANGSVYGWGYNNYGQLGLGHTSDRYSPTQAVLSSCTVKNIDVSPNVSICPGGSTTISATPIGGVGPYTYSWSPSTGLSSTTIYNPVASPTSATTYTASITDANGCSFSTSQVTVSIYTVPTATISGGGSICTTGSSSASVALTGTGPWTIVYNDGTNNITVTGIASSPYVINATAPGTYTLVSVSDANCTGTYTGSASVTNSGCSCGATLASNSWGIGYTLAPGSYYSSSNITVSGNVTLTNVILTMAAGTTITINNTASLTLDHSHIYSCANMWQGIIVSRGSTLDINNGSLIEDAILAVDVPLPNSSTFLIVNNAIFNKNLDAIGIDTYQNTSVTVYSNFEITKTVFTCRSLPFSTTWPTVASLQTLTSAGTLSEHYTMGSYSTAALKAPNSANPPNSGIMLTDVGILSGGVTYREALIDGDDGNGTINLFDNMLFGITADNSNFTCRNNAFQYIIEDGANTGIAINATDAGAGFSTDNRLRVVTSSGTTTANWFYDCTTGINSDNYNDVTVNYTDMRSTQMPSGSTPPEGDMGIYVKTPNCTQISIENNLITNVRTGIAFYADGVGSPAAQEISAVQILDNTIQANYGTLAGGEYPLIGIVANNLVTGTLPIFTTHGIYNINVSGNHLHDLHNGISMSNWIHYLYTPTTGFGNRAVSHDNYISLLEQTYPSSGVAQAGIAHLSNTGNHIYTNNIEGFDNSSDLWYGIYSACTTIQDRQLVTCNRTYNVGQGIYFIGDHGDPQFERNEMESDGKGFVLDNAKINTQGGSTSASDNEWTGTYSGGQYTTYSWNSSIVTDSKLYIQSGSPYDPAAVGTCYSNTPLIPNTIYSSGTSLLSSTGSSGVSCSTLPTSKLINTGGAQTSDFSIDADIAMMERLVSDSVYYYIFSEQQYTNARHKVYRLLNMQPAFNDSSEILNDFYTGAQASNIGKLVDIENKLASAQLADATAALNNITASNAIEANYKNYYTAYLHFKQHTFTSEDSLNLKQLQLGCTVRDGAIVQQARSLYSLVYTDFAPHFDNCTDTTIALRSLAPASVSKTKTDQKNIEIYPNPSNGSFTIYLVGEFENEIVDVTINDVTGKLVKSVKVKPNGNKILIENELSNGVYLISVRDKKGYTYKPEKITVIK